MMWRCVALLVSIAATASCGGSETEPTNQGSTNQGTSEAAGQDAKISVVATEDIEPGEECEFGGARVTIGVDEDRDGVLGTEEVASGTTTVLCRARSAGCSQPPLQLDGLDGLDQIFVEGVESNPLAVQMDAATDVQIRVIATDMLTTTSDNSGEFTLTPTKSGGPWRIGVIAFDGCTVDVETFVIDEVVRNLAYVRGFNTIRPYGVDISGPDSALLSLSPRAGSALIELDVGPIALDFASSLPNIMAPGDEVLDARLNTQYDVVTYSDVDADAFGLKWIFLESDSAPSPTDARLRPINLHRDVAMADIRVLGAAQTAFDGLSYAQSAPMQDTAPGFALGVDLDRDGTDDRNFVFSDRLLAAGTVANVFLVSDEDTSAAPTDAPVALIAQYIDEKGGAEVGEEVGALPLGFEGGAVPVFASLEGDADWFVATDETASGAFSMRSGWVSSERVSRLRLKIAVPTAGTFSFDWKVRGRGLESLYFCLPGVDPCDIITNSAKMTIGSIHDRAWEQVSVPLTAGVHELRWEFRVGSYRVPGEDIGGWIDDLTFTPDAP